MNSTEGLNSLELLFAGYSDLKSVAPRFLLNNLTSQHLRGIKGVEEVDNVATLLELTLAQKTQLKSVLFPNNTSTSTQQNSGTNNTDTTSSKVTLQAQALGPIAIEERKSGSKEEKKKKKIAKIAINTTRSRGELKLLKSLIEKNKEYGWKETTGMNGDIMWSGLDIPWEDTYIAQDIKLNRIPGMKSLSHKKATGFYLNKFREYYPDEFDFYPRTFLIPEELDRFKTYMEEHPDKLFIAKPTSGSQGDGIILVRKFSDLPLSSYTSNEMVVQEYLDKPLLHDGKKFDLRIYVLISNVKPMLAFLNEEGLARFCTENYAPPTRDNLKNCYMHLTNYSLNKLSSNYKYTEECTEINDGSKRSLASLWKGLERDGISKDQIIDNIKPLLQRLLVSLQPIIQFNYNSAFEGKDTGSCFHVLGVDILVDQDLKPWLLEINANPSLNIGHEDSTDPKAKEIISPVDKYVKEKVVEDALLIVKKSVEKQNDLEKYRTYTKIYDSENGNFSEMELFTDILEIFGKLSGVKFKTHMTSSKFRKLGAIAGMTNEKLVKAHYDIIYQKMVRRSEDNQMNFPVFIEALEEITSILKKGDYDPENKRSFIEEVVGTIKLGLH